MTEGTNGGNLESMLTDHIAQVRDGDRPRASNWMDWPGAWNAPAAATCNASGFLRFNPFRDAGGDQSFAVALTDQDGNGVVISSLHSRDVTRVYGKPLAAWESPYPLTEEEQTGDQEGEEPGARIRDQGSGTE